LADLRFPMKKIEKKMGNQQKSGMTDIIGGIPYRMAFAGGWIDQPFVSRHNPNPPGSMVVVAIEPTLRFMDRCGMGTSTRKIAINIWGDQLPDRNPVELVKELYAAENEGLPAPSGSQDMAGIIYPGINRLDYDFDHEGGYFPVNVLSNTNHEVARWLENHIYVVPVVQRALGYDPLEEKNLDPVWIQRLGQTGKDCFNAIVEKDALALGESMNECMLCWENILPNTVRHHSILFDLVDLLSHYQKNYYGGMYSGCGGGYIYVVSEEPVPGGFQIKIRLTA